MAREQARVQYFVEVTLESSSGRRQARISDLGLGGCFIDSIAIVSEGEPVSFELSEPGGEKLAFTGEVTYSLTGVGFGVRFTHVTDEQQAFLEKVVAASTEVSTVP